MAAPLKKPSEPPTSQQRDILLDHLLENKQYVQGRFSHATGITKTSISEFWEETAKKMNQLPGSKKSGEEWKSFYGNLKNEARSEAAMVNKHLNQTGGANPIDFMEDHTVKVLAIADKGSYTELPGVIDSAAQQFQEMVKKSGQVVWHAKEVPESVLHHVLTTGQAVRAKTATGLEYIKLTPVATTAQVRSQQTPQLRALLAPLSGSIPAASSGRRLPAAAEATALSHPGRLNVTSADRGVYVKPRFLPSTLQSTKSTFPAAHGAHVANMSVLEASSAVASGGLRPRMQKDLALSLGENEKSGSTSCAKIVEPTEDATESDEEVLIVEEEQSSPQHRPVREVTPPLPNTIDTVFDMSPFSEYLENAKKRAPPTPEPRPSKKKKSGNKSKESSSDGDPSLAFTRGKSYSAKGKFQVVADAMLQAAAVTDRKAKAKEKIELKKLAMEEKKLNFEIAKLEYMKSQNK